MKLPEFQENQLYKRSAIHDAFGGSRQSGISPSRKVPAVFMFTGESGEQYGYSDSWDQARQVFTYTGEGQVGDMTMNAGNAAIAEHVEEGRALHLFKVVPDKELQTETLNAPGRGYCRYVGEMQCAGVIEGLGLDKNNDQRKIFQFQLVRIQALEDTEEARHDVLVPPAFASGTTSIEELRNRAIQAAASEKKPVRDAKRKLYERARHVVEYALARADGLCEACGAPAPFLRSNGAPYLEVHHIDRLSDGGLDAPDRVAGICPTCHRKIHCGDGGEALNQELRRKIKQVEATLLKDHS